MFFHFLITNRNKKQREDNQSDEGYALFVNLRQLNKRQKTAPTAGSG